MGCDFNSFVQTNSTAPGIGISFASHTFHLDRKNCEAIEKVLAVPALSASWQKSFQELKATCGGPEISQAEAELITTGNKWIASDIPRGLATGNIELILIS